MGWRVATVSPAIALLLAAGCTVRALDPVPAGDTGAGGSAASSGSGGGAGAVVTPPAIPRVGLCGGTVEAAGTTPLGDFKASTVGAEYICDANLYVRVDDAAGLVLWMNARLQWVDGGSALVLGDVAVSATLYAAPSATASVTTTGTMNLTLADVPTYGDGGGIAGGVAGTFSFSQDGFTLTGSFASPYCSVFTLCGD